MDTISIRSSQQTIQQESANEAYKHPKLRAVNHTQESFIKSRLHKEQFGFMFVRNPLHRILSRYIDRKVGNQWHFNLETNLPEFLQHISSQDYPQSPDSQLFFCDPCLLKISFLGKWETVKNDLAYLVKNVTALGKVMAYNAKRNPSEEYLVGQQFLTHRRMLRQHIPRKLLLQILWTFRLEYLVFGYDPFDDLELRLNSSSQHNALH